MWRLVHSSIKMSTWHCLLPWELRCVLGGNRSESGIIILYSASELVYLVLALYKHALFLLYIIPKYMAVWHCISVCTVWTYGKLTCVNCSQRLLLYTKHIIVPEIMFHETGSISMLTAVGGSILPLTSIIVWTFHQYMAWNIFPFGCSLCIRWWLMFYCHFCACGWLNGPSDLQR